MRHSMSKMSKERDEHARDEGFDAVLSSDNVKLLRRSMEAWNAGDVQAWLETLDPAVKVWPLDLDRSPYRGHDGAREFLATLAGDWGDVCLRSESFHASGDQVLALGHLEARGRGEDRLRFTSPAAWLVRLRDRKIVRWKVFTDQNEALKAAGLRR
jgi:ketosteroid isomerase-like protein